MWWRITEAHCLVTILYLENTKTHFTEGGLTRALGHSISSITTILKEIYQFENDIENYCYLYFYFMVFCFTMFMFHVPVSSLSCLQRLLWKFVFSGSHSHRFLFYFDSPMYIIFSFAYYVSLLQSSRGLCCVLPTSCVIHGFLLEASL